MRSHTLLLLLLLLGFALKGQDFSDANYLTSTPFELRSAVLADLDNDGDLDAIIAGIGFNASGIETYINHDGEFELITDNIPFATYGAGALATADIDSDGDQDLIAVIESKLVWFANNGNAHFVNPILIANNLPDVRSIATGELDEVAGPDILITRIDGNALLAYGNDGNGVFANAVVVSSTTTDAIDALIGDIDGDGLNDVIAACLNACDVTWHKNLGNMNFGAQNILTTAQGGTYKLALDDFDGNGHLDIASVGFGSDDLMVFLNAGNGAFGVPSVISTTLDGASNLVSGDFNGDGIPDLCVGTENQPLVTYFEGDGSGGFLQLTLTELGTAFNPEVYLAGDVDGDGKVDLVTASQGHNKLALFRQKDGNIAAGNAPFESQVLINRPAPGINGLVSADVNGDGLQDLVSSESAAGRIVLYAQESEGVFSPGRTLLALSEGVSGVNSGDFNGDGQADIVATFSSDSTLILLLNESFGESFVPHVIDQGLKQPYRPLVADLDNDGNADILLAVGLAGKVYIYPGNGDGTFSDRLTLCDDCFLTQASAVGDLNGDNLPEIVLSLSQNIVFFPNLGELSFGEPQVIIAGLNGARDIELFDLDQDGDLDVFACSIFEPKIKYVVNTGNLNFLPVQEVPLNFYGAYDLQVIDVDMDGDFDLGITEFFANKIRVIVIENGEFTSQFAVDNVFENPTALVAADLNNDGKPDLASCYRNTLSTYINETNACNLLVPNGLGVEVTNALVHFTWNPIPGTEACRLTLRNLLTQETFQQNIIQNEPSSFSAPIGFFDAGLSYAWKIQCACSLEPVVATLSSGVAFFTIGSTVAAWPNPAQSTISLQEDGNAVLSNGAYTVFDLLGKPVMQGIYQGTIDVSSLPRGYYIVQWEAERIKFLKD